MKTLEQWFSLYGESHQNPTNIVIHKIAVPLIYFSVVAILCAVPVSFNLTLALLLSFAVLAFYFYLSRKLGIVMTLFTSACFTVISLIPGSLIVPIALSVFVVAWLFQFIGHKIEGKKPSFFDDLSFLLIGPAWVFNPVFNFVKK